MEKGREVERKEGPKGTGAREEERNRIEEEVNKNEHGGIQGTQAAEE